MITCLENSINKDNEYCSLFLIEPLNLGYGITLGTALRRVILSEIKGLSISSIHINGISHEYVDLGYIRETTNELLLNLKKIIFKSLTSPNTFPIKGNINVKGPKIVTASFLKLTNKNLITLNTSQYLCSITKLARLFIKLDIEEGYGYKPSTEMDTKQIKLQKTSNRIQSKYLFPDQNFNPIKKVNYKIALVQDKNGLLKESLLFEIYTNGCVSPLKAIKESTQILLNLFYPLAY